MNPLKVSDFKTMKLISFCAQTVLFSHQPLLIQPKRVPPKKIPKFPHLTTGISSIIIISLSQAGNRGYPPAFVFRLLPGVLFAPPKVPRDKIDQVICMCLHLQKKWCGRFRCENSGAGFQRDPYNFTVPKIEVLNLIKLFWGWGFPYLTLTYSLYR